MLKHYPPSDSFDSTRASFSSRLSWTCISSSPSESLSNAEILNGHPVLPKSAVTDSSFQEKLHIQMYLVLKCAYVLIMAKTSNSYQWMYKKYLDDNFCR